MKKNGPKLKKPENKTKDPLREKAEEFVKKGFGTIKPEAFSDEESRRLIHELKTHQIELEIQNEELRNAQLSLEDARKRYADLYDFAPVGYFTLDRNGIILEANLTGASMLGVEMAKLLKVPFTRFISREDKDTFYLHRNKVIETAERQTCEVQLKKKDGGVFYVQCESLRAEGNLCRTVISDVTRRKQAEKEVKHLASFPELNPNPVIEVNSSGKVIFHNPATEKLLERLDLAKEDVSVFLPVDMHAILGSFKKKPITFSRIVTVKDRTFGESIYLAPEFSTARIYVHDITERIQAGEALRESEERLAVFSRATFEGIVESENGVIIDCNEQFATMLGRTVEGLRGAAIADLIAPEDRDRVLANIMSNRESMIEHAVLRSDGTKIFVEARGRTVSPGNVRRHTAIRDITERKRAERQLASDLDAMTRLQKLGALSAQEGNLEPILNEILDGAIAISGADFGNIQLLDPASGDLRIAVQRGFPQWWIEFWDSVSKGKGACGTALERGGRVIVEDVEQSPIFIGTPALEVQLRAGVRAVQSTPLVTRTGRAVGMFSTHFKTRHRLDDRELRLLDLLARQAADVIERAEAEAALRESERRERERAAELQTILDTAPIGIAITIDTEGRHIRGNPTNERMFGLTPGAELSKTAPQSAGFRVFCAGRELPAAELPMQRAVRGETVIGQEMDVVCRDGKIVNVHASATPLLDEAGRPRGAVGAFLDITARKRAEEMIRQAKDELEVRVRERTKELIELNEKLEVEIAERRASEEQRIKGETKYRMLSEEFDVLLNSITDSMVLFSPDRKVLWSNKASNELLDRNAVDVVGQPCFTLWHSRDDACMDCPVARSFRTGNPENGRVTTPKEKTLELYAFPIKDDEGKTRNVILAARDITETMKLQEKTLSSGKMAALGEMAAGIAHEINNPVNSIINYAQILANKADDQSKEYEFASGIVEEGERIAAIVRSLLTFARDSQETRQLLSLRNVLSSTLVLTGTQMRKDGVRLNVAVPDTLPAIVGNLQQLQQVFLNVLNNARYALNERYHEEHKDKVLDILGRIVTIGDRQCIRLIFRDQGTGMPARVLERVKEPFFTTKPAGKGTGLGLSICNSIIADHGGTLTISSVEGEHTEVTIDLPVNEDREE